MKRILGITVMGFLAICLAACGSGGGTSTTTTIPSIDSLSDLPGATSPMASTSANISSKSLSFKAATTGQAFSSITTFDSTDSRAACEVFNVLKEAFQSAAEADTILCYIDKMNSEAQAFDSDDLSGIDIYDGAEHIFGLNIVGQDGSPDKVKMTISKNAAGNIDSFEMFACASDTQIEYINLAIDGTSVEMSAKGIFADSNWSGSHSVTVSGTLNADGAYTERTIATKNTGGAQDSSGTNWSEVSVTQTPGAYVLSGYQSGTWSQGGNSGSYAESAYGVGALLGDDSVLSALALGDGAVYVDALYTSSAFEDYDPVAEVFAWLGDDASIVDPATGSDHYVAAAAGTPPDVESSVSITFAEGETWDCSGTATELPEMSNSIFSECESLNHNWINCYEIIGE